MMVAFCLNPEIEEKCRQEVLSIMKTDRAPIEDDINMMPYLHATVLETLRMHPPIFVTGRLSTVKFDLGEGHCIPSGTTIIAHYWSIHHNPKYWDNPMKFNPERFLMKDFNQQLRVKMPENMHPGAFIPFGAGPRACPGRGLAILQARLIMAAVLQKFYFQFSSGQNFVPFQATTLAPKYGIMGRLVPY